MTSQVNPNNIDGTYPIAGQDNDSQGFRDNFTNTKNNFQFVYDEISDLQAKAVLKSALTSSTLSNDFTSNEIVNATLRSFGETYYNAGALGGAQTIDYTNGNFQRVQLSGALTLSFSNWPNATPDASPKPIAGRLILQIRIEAAGVSGGYTVTFPSETTLGFPSTMNGISGLTVTYPQAGDYFYEIISFDNGSTFFTRELGRMPNTVQGNLTVTGNVITSGTGSFIGNVVGDVYSSAGVKVLDNGGTGVDAVFTGTHTGNVILSGTKVESGYQYVAAANNFNITVNNNVSRVILDPASSLVNGTITLPSANVDATIVTISSTQAITNFQVKPNTGITLVPSANVTQSGGQAATFFFHAAESKWYKIG